jgi:secondary thiamine-phosphate synthase enzyme
MEAQSSGGAVLAGQLSAVLNFAPELVTTATLIVDTKGQGFSDITGEAKRFVAESKAGDGVFFIYLRHTSASLVIQENADPDVQTDLATALERMAPANAPWVHKVEGQDDMPAHIKAMVTGVSLHIPVNNGELWLGTWQGLYLIEHRSAPHKRELMLQFVGNRRVD